jgi:hypothetical protein
MSEEEAGIDMKVSEFRDGLPTPEVSDAPAVERFPLNENGRDFVVGDIHGMFEHLSRLLTDIAFDEETDRVFSVGDLVDRGPESRRALEWLDNPWFFACRGNHEQFAIDSTDPEQLDVWVNYNGGEWWTDLDVEEKEAFRALCHVVAQPDFRNVHQPACDRQRAARVLWPYADAGNRSNRQRLLYRHRCRVQLRRLRGGAPHPGGNPARLPPGVCHQHPRGRKIEEK